MSARRRRLPTKPAAPPWKWGVALLSAVLLMTGGWLAAGSPRENCGITGRDCRE